MIDDIHIIISVRDEKKFRVLVSESPTGTRFQWPVDFGVTVAVDQRLSATILNKMMYDLVEFGGEETS